MTKADFIQMKKEDASRYNVVPSIKDRLVLNEGWYIYNLVRHVRNIEYHTGKGGWHKFARLWNKYQYKRLSLKLNITIYPGTIGGGNSHIPCRRIYSYWKKLPHRA